MRTNTERLDTCTHLLADFIGYRTENPGSDEMPLAARLAEELEARAADAVHLCSVPRPGREAGGYVYARYGEPRLLINVHLDTVPANTGWTRDPFTATIDQGRLYGLGSADTKGAIACVLTVLDELRPRDLGVLFSGDEENGTHCVRDFVGSEHLAGIERAIICEPTARRAGTRHRGIRAYRAHVRGQGGHSSQADIMPKPVVTMARLAISMDELGRAHLDSGPDDMKGLCMNVARLDGGVAFNVIPDSASLRFSVRPPPGFDTQALDAEVAARARAIDANIELDRPLSAEPFQCRDPDAFRAILGEHVRGFVPLDFWTEAAIMSESGVDAVVVGPGDIGHAHAPDEYVTLDDLGWAMDLFAHVIAQY